MVQSTSIPLACTLLAYNAVVKPGDIDTFEDIFIDNSDNAEVSTRAGGGRQWLVVAGGGWRWLVVAGGG